MTRFFPIKTEAHMRQRILREHREEIGTTVSWYVWIPDPTRTRRHPIYGESGVELGRQWEDPIRLPVIDALIVEGASVTTAEGFTVLDSLQVFTTRWDLELHGLHDLSTNRRLHYKDRIEAKGKMWVPLQIEGTGKFKGYHTGVTVVAREVRPNESVLDEQFTTPPDWGPYTEEP